MDTKMKLTEVEVARYLAGLREDIDDLPSLVANWHDLDAGEQAGAEAEWWANIRSTWAGLTRQYAMGGMSPRSARTYEQIQAALIASIPLLDQLGWSDLRTGILSEAKPVHA